MSMKENLEQIRSEALAAINAEGADLEALRIKYLGKKGELTAVLKQMGKLSAEERPIMGQMANLRSINVVDGVVILQTLNDEVFRDERGKRPVLDMRDPVKLRLVHLKEILKKAIKRYSDATA